MALRIRVGGGGGVAVGPNAVARGTGADTTFFSYLVYTQNLYFVCGVNTGLIHVSSSLKVEGLPSLNSGFPRERNKRRAEAEGSHGEALGTNTLGNGKPNRHYYVFSLHTNFELRG